MFLKCLECGHIFEDGEQRTYAEHHPYGDTTADEYFSVCPICGGEYEETKSCKCCGGAFLEEELLGGYYCFDCLKASVDFDNFLDFATSGTNDPTEVDTLEDFMLREVFEVNGRNEVLTCSSSAFKSFLRDVYSEFVKDDKLKQTYSTKGKSDLKEKICSYLTDCELWEYFAEYLYEKENEEKEKEEPLKCSRSWCQRWEPEGCQLAYNCEDFDWTHDEEVK